MKITNIKENRFFCKENLLVIFLTILLFGIYIKNISDISVFSILDDEFGYWANAAYFAGYDWSGVASNIKYYSYGYSIILTPLFLIFDDPIVMYKVSILLNAIMLYCSFLLCYDISKKLSRDTNRTVLILISFVISMYPAYIVQTNVAWCESALIFFVWLLVRLLMSINDKSKQVTLLVLGMLSFYIYIIHQRAIGIVISSIIVVCIMKITNKITWTQLCWFFIGIVLLLSIHVAVKDNLQANLYLSSQNIAANDFSGQIKKIRDLFTFNGFINFIRIYASQLFYIGTASFLMVFLAMYEIAIKLTSSFKDLYYTRKLNIIDKNEKIFLYMFLIIAFCFTTFISALFMTEPSRIDHIVYGRYNEMLIGPIILIGFMNLISDKAKIRNIIYIITIYLFLTVITNLVLTIYGIESNNFINASGLYVKPTIANSYNVFTSSIISIIGFMCIYISFCLKKPRNIAAIAATLLFISYLFYNTANPFVKKYLVAPNIARTENEKIAEFIYSNDENLPIYFLLSDDFMKNIYKDFHQFLLADKRIICITESELSTLDNQGYLIVTDFTKLLQLIDEYAFCINANESFLLVTKNSKTAEKINSLNNLTGYEMSLNSFFIQNAKKSDSIQAEGINGFFMYGPYIDLKHGKYQISVELELVDSFAYELGYIDIVTDEGRNIIYKQEINKDHFENDNKLIIDMPIILNGDTKGLEIRAYSYEDSKFNVNHVYINYE